MKRIQRSVLAVALAFGGCADTSSGDSDPSELETESDGPDIEAQALASVEMGNGAEVRFYELEPGIVVKAYTQRIGESR